MAYSFMTKAEEYERKLLTDLLAKSKDRASKVNTVVSVSSIYDKIYNQYVTFLNSLGKSKLPLEMVEVTVKLKDKEPAKYLSIYVKKNKEKSKYSYQYLPIEDPTVSLTLTEEEIRMGVTLYPENPMWVLLGNIPTTHFRDENGSNKYRLRHNFDGSPIIVRGDGSIQGVYEVNPNYSGGVKYTEKWPTKKEAFVPAIFKDTQGLKWSRGTLDSNNLPSDVKRNPLPNSTTKSIKMIAFVKIIKYDESATLFGYSGIKKEMFESNGLFNIADILIDFKCKKDEKIRDVVEICYNGKTYKFLGEELEFMYPDIEELTKGYSLPKDRAIKADVTCKVTDDRGSKLNRGDKVTVVKKVFKDYYEVIKEGKRYIINKKQLKVM